MHPDYHHTARDCQHDCLIAGLITFCLGISTGGVLAIALVQFTFW